MKHLGREVDCPGWKHISSPALNRSVESLLTLKLFINTSLTDTSLHLITMEGISAERDDY